MEKSCLQYRLTEEERETFERTGYLILEDALSSEQVESLTNVCDDLFERKVLEGHVRMEHLFVPCPSNRNPANERTDQ
jgi:ectoine hydroxylase